MDFRILGPIQAWDGQRLVPLGGRKRRALLAILLLRANQPVTADRLIDLLWGEQPPTTAGSTLQVHISQLRKVLEPEHRPGAPYTVLVSHQQAYALNVRPDQVDLERFRALVQTARVERDAGHLEAAADHLRQALSMWRGDALADLETEPFAAGDAARLNEQRLSAIEDRVEVDLALGRHSDIIGELESLTSQYPLHEAFARQLMLALYRSGRQGEASAAFHRIREVLDTDFGMQPGPPVQELYTAILNQDPALDLPFKAPPPESAPPDNLPAPITSFVGRERELGALLEALDGARLITIAGIGGAGKTRLAIEVARARLPRQSDGAWVVELAPLSDPRLVAQTIASALAIPEAPGQAPITALSTSLRPKQLLLVLDNCEHLLDACARLTDALLKNCAQLRILATSREPLGIIGEIVWRLDPLELPGPRLDGAHVPLNASAIAQVASVQLFVDRARAVAPGFRLNDRNADSVAQLCRTVEGIPLAIELAAGWLRVVGIDEVVTHLEDRFSVLTGGNRMALPKQTTLRATLDWSYDLLAEPERSLFRRLAIFGGSWTLEEAEVVCASGNVQRGDVLDLLTHLVDKSLVIADDVDGSVRYRLLEVVHQYADEKLTASGELADVAQRHATYYMLLAERVEPGLHGADQVNCLRQLNTEYENLRVALAWTTSGTAEPQRQQGKRLVGALMWHWLMSGHFSEAHGWFQAVTVGQSATQATAIEARALCGAGYFAFLQGDERANELLDKSIALARQASDPYTTALALNCASQARMSEPEAQEMAEESVALFRLAGSRFGEGVALTALGEVARLRGDDALAAECNRQAAAAHLELGDQWSAAITLQNLAQLALHRHDVETAADLFRQSLRIFEEFRSVYAMPYAVAGLAGVAAATHQGVRAARLLGAVDAAFAASGSVMQPTDRADVDRILDEAREQLRPTEFARAWAEGQAMSLEAAAAYALETA